MKKLVLILLALTVLGLAGCGGRVKTKLPDAWIIVAPANVGNNQPIDYYHDTINGVGIWRTRGSDYIVIIPDRLYFNSNR
jgi:predicted small lipoprotein YifL